MKSLKHNGIYIVKYNPIGLYISIRGKRIELDSEAENMAIQFVKKLDTPYMQDQVFVSNFLEDFRNKLKMDTLNLEDIDWGGIKEYLDSVRVRMENMTKEEKKLASQLRGQLKEKLKEKYGYAVVDGERIELQSYMTEPASIFLSKGHNPNRGRWKREIKPEEITLNLSPDAENREELSKSFNVVWEPTCYWIAKWPEVFDSTRYKYIWFSPTSTLRQDREKKKFELASRLEGEIGKVDSLIAKELVSKDTERRKLATAVYLIRTLGIRVGDEKIAGERGTVGCTTLKSENVTLGENNHVTLDFMGKDAVHWHRELTVPLEVYNNLKELIGAKESYIFQGLNSTDVSSFLREAVPRISAKVFRTYLAGTLWDKHAKENLKKIDSETSLHVKKYLFKMINLEVAKNLNHQKALPKNYEEHLVKKENQYKKEKEKLDSMQEVDKQKYRRQKERVEKLSCELELLKKTAKFNLGTSLQSYISPIKVRNFIRQAGLQIADVYPRTLREKFSWALQDHGG